MPIRRTIFSRACILFLGVCAANLAIAQTIPRSAPPNPAFVANQSQPVTVRAEGDGLGYRPSPVDFSYLTGRQIFGAATRATFPASYDLRALGKVTPVRNQSPYNTCWTFAAYGSLESSLQPGESRDFSEMNMARMHGFTLKVNEGGSMLMALAYLARWSGAVNEADDPYSSSLSPSNPPVQKHLQDAMIIPDRGGPLDNNNIKQALMTHGGVYSTMYWTPAAFNFSTHGFYYSGSTGSNHSITIVGWDDNYPRGNFITPPPGNGAFIVKNSYGAGWGDKGYLYISYYDKNIGKSNGCFYHAEPATNYARIYQHDPYGLTGHAGYGTATAWFANVFTAVSQESLAAASFYTAGIGTSYEVSVYLNPANGPLSAAGAVSRQTGTIATPGYHTVRLSSPVALSAGQRFAVVVKVNTPGYGYPIPLEQQRSGFTPNATAGSGQGYMSSDGRSWSDVTKAYPNASACLKAFTQLRTVAPARPDMLVRTAGETSFTGESIYSLNGTGQTKQQAAGSGVPAVYYLKVKNQGDAAGNFGVVGPIGSGGWAMRYFDSQTGGMEITLQVAKMLAGGWKLSLNARAEKVIRVEVALAPGFVPSTANTAFVKVLSTANTALADVAALITGTQ